MTSALTASSSSPISQQIVTLRQQVKKAFQAKQYDTVRSCYKTFLQQFPKHLEGMIGLGELAYYQKEPDRALAQFTKAIDAAKTGTQKAACLLRRARVLFQKEQFQAALQDLEKANDYHLEDIEPEILFIYASFLFDLGKEDPGDWLFGPLLTLLEPFKEKALYPYWVQKLALAVVVEANENYKKETASDHPGAFIAQSFLWFQQAEHEKALVYAQRALAASKTPSYQKSCTAYWEHLQKKIEGREKIQKEMNSYT